MIPTECIYHRKIKHNRICQKTWQHCMLYVDTEYCPNFIPKQLR